MEQGGTRRGWLGVVLVAALVGCGIGAGVGAAVSAAIHTGNTTIIRFSPNTSVFRRMGDIQSVLGRVLPSVVAIQASGPACTKGPLGNSGSQFDEGTGMILTSSGEILTNNHVIANATQIKVTLYGQTKAYPATLVGTDPAYDVALLQVHGADDLSPVTLGQSSKTQVGDDVLAIGNALALSAEHALGDRGNHLRRGPVHRGRRGCLRGQRVADRAPPNPGADQPRQLGRAARRQRRPGHRHEHRRGDEFGRERSRAEHRLRDPHRQCADAPARASQGRDDRAAEGVHRRRGGLGDVPTPAERSAYGLTPTIGALVVSVVLAPRQPRRVSDADDVIVKFEATRSRPTPRSPRPFERRTRANVWRSWCTGVRRF